MSKKDADAFTRSNPYKVPKSQWRKWDLKAKSTFNRLFSFMYRNQDLFLHPKGAKAKAKPAHWKTTAWNAAWIAADIVHEKVILRRQDYS